MGQGVSTGDMTEQTDQPRILSLCSGYGGLDMVMEKLTGGRLVAYAEKMPAAAKVMAHHYPDVPNLGDITEIDWPPWVGRVDIIGAGFPCQDISDAGHRQGISGDRSGIWKNVCEAVGTTRPRLAFLENVAAIRSRGLDVVAKDLARVGYELRWTCLRASQVGAPHPRSRWFGLAKPLRNSDGVKRQRPRTTEQPQKPYTS